MRSGGQLQQIDTATSALAQVVYRAAHFDLPWEQLYDEHPAHRAFSDWMKTLTEGQISKFQRQERLTGQPQGPAYFGNRTYWTNRKLENGKYFTPLPTGILCVRTFYQYYDEEKSFDLRSKSIVFGLDCGIVYFDVEPQYFLPKPSLDHSVSKAQHDKLCIDIGKRSLKPLSIARARYGAWALDEREVKA
jgi:hypothetical protein